MLDFILSFLGLRPSGFKRQNVFFSTLGRIIAPRANKRSIKYLAAFLFASLILTLDYANSLYTDAFKKRVSPYFLTAKCFVNEIIELPKVVSEYMHLKKENVELRRQIDDLKVKITTSRNIEAEYEALKNSVELKYSMSNYKFIEKILGFDKSSYNSFLIISATHDSSKEGVVVISSDGLVGLIFDSSNGIARVLTISDQKLCVPVKSDSGEHLILSGDGKDRMISREIRQTDSEIKLKLKEGDVLYTSGEGGVFQAGIPVAKVTKIKNDDTVYAEPIVHFNNLSFVWIVAPFLK